MSKPLNNRFCVVTASTNLERSRACRWSWEAKATYRWPVYTVLNGRGPDAAQSMLAAGDYLGTVPAFAEGVRRALAGGHEIIACLHDDLLIEEEGWDAVVLRLFAWRQSLGLLGFLGGTGLGDSDIYQTFYSPHQLARQGVYSNERNAEAHGKRVQTVQRVAVLDGFSQIGRAAFWQGLNHDLRGWVKEQSGAPTRHAENLFAQMASWGMVHHAYDAALGCFAKRLGWEVWMLPVACWHQGGQTAVGDAGYQEWAKGIVPGGDQDFWELAHKIVYDQFRDCLPIRVGGAR